jgi:hypothetical protein
VPRDNKQEALLILNTPNVEVFLNPMVLLVVMLSSAKHLVIALKND